MCYGTIHTMSRHPLPRNESEREGEMPTLPRRARLSSSPPMRVIFTDATTVPFFVVLQRGGDDEDDEDDDKDFSKYRVDLVVESDETRLVQTVGADSRPDCHSVQCITYRRTPIFLDDLAILCAVRTTADCENISTGFESDRCSSVAIFLHKRGDRGSI